MNKIILFLSINLITAHTDLYDPLKSTVQKLTPQNWQNILQKGIQNDNTYIVHFHDFDDGVSYDFSKEFEKRSDKFNGILQFGFVNCGEYKKFCEKEASRKRPFLRVFPPVPIPSFDLDLDVKQAVNKSVRYVKNYVKTL